jgi:glycosyltransferase involved in cell wall biosynthesis
MTVREALLALRELPETVHLAFVGRNHDRNRGLVRELGVGDRAHLLAPVPPTEVVRFIAGADASPILYRAQSASYESALPNGFFHAVAAGLPILYPPLPEIRALCVEHGMGAEIRPEEPGSIAAGVRSLLDDPARAGEYRARAEAAREVLNWEHEERLVADLLEGTATLPGRSRPGHTGPGTQERMDS